MEFVQKKFVKLIYVFDFMSFFGLDFFKFSGLLCVITKIFLEYFAETVMKLYMMMVSSPLMQFTYTFPPFKVHTDGVIFFYLGKTSIFLSYISNTKMVMNFQCPPLCNARSIQCCNIRKECNFVTLCLKG